MSVKTYGQLTGETINYIFENNSELVTADHVQELVLDIVDTMFALTGSTPVQSQYWTSGSTGAYSIKANNDSGLDATADYSVAEGLGTQAQGPYSHAEGQGTVTVGDRAHAEGYNTQANGVSSHAEGSETVATGVGSHAEGDGATAGGDAAHAEGHNTQAANTYSHAEGDGSIANGMTSHAEGSGSQANNVASHAENSSIANGQYSHSEGSTIAEGDYAHSEGLATVASGYVSHAEGYTSVANGQFSHAEGNGNTANGEASHVEGYDNTTDGSASHAGGSSNYVYGKNAFAHGDSNNIVGNNAAAFGNGNRVEGLNGFASGLNHYIPSYVDNVAILGGSLITATTKSTTYVPYFNIKQADTNTNNAFDILVRESDGTIWKRPLTGLTDVYTTGMTFSNTTYILTGNRNDGSSYSANLAILASDVTITGGTYNNATGIATFANSSGGTFQVSGFTTGMTDTYVTGLTYNRNLNRLTIDNSNGSSVSTDINQFTGLTVTSLSSTTFNYRDGNQALNKILTSDANGTASWQTPAFAGTLIYMFTNAASSISPYYQMVTLPSYSTGTTATVTSAVTTSPTLFTSFATNVGFPNIGVIPAGTVSFHFETQKTAGSNNYYCYAELYKRTTGGTETLICTSDNTSQTAVNTLVSQDVQAVISSNVFMNLTDRMVVKFYGVMVSSSANISFFFDDSTNARIEFPSVNVDATNFIPYNGATSAVNLGSNNLNTSSQITSNVLSSTTISAGTINSGSTNLNQIFVGGISAGTNMIVAGTTPYPSVATTLTPTFTSISTTTLSAGTIYSGSTNLYNVFKTTDIYTTGGTYYNGTATFGNSTGGTFSVTGLTTPFTGGTVTGDTFFTGALTANTITATTIYGSFSGNALASTYGGVGDAWVNYTNSSTIVGFSGSPAAIKSIMIKKIGTNTLAVNFYFSGLSSGTTFSFTVPNASLDNVYSSPRTLNNASYAMGMAELIQTTSTVNIYTTAAGGTFSNNVPKMAAGQFFMRI